MCGAFAMSAAGSVEERAGEIEPLADVDRDGRRLQHGAHLFRHLHEPVVEELELRGIGASRVDWPTPAAASCRSEAERAVGQALGRPAGLDDGRGVGLDDERRACERRARGKRGALDERHLAPAVEPGVDAAGRTLARGPATATRASRSPVTTASTASVATSGSESGGAKPKRRVNTARNSRNTSASGAWAISSAVSVPGARSSSVRRRRMSRGAAP